MIVIVAVNAVLECLVTGLFTALCLLGMARIGWLPILIIAPLEEDMEDE